jgi:peptidyl-prolyl cis-trans isomerase SurA
MKNLLSIFAISVLLSTSLAAQKNTIVTIDGRDISKEEFETIYKKNNTNLNDENEVKSPQDYMKMFIDFKLKVVEAENRGLDTVQSFISELAGYRDELAKTYLTDVSINDSMVKEAYYRTVNLVKVSHILIELGENATPDDTLKVYNKLIQIRNMYLNKEKTFGELAQEYSDDPGSNKDSGQLPYFTAFRMITPFENVAYSTKVGEVSMPFRTQVGYHILKVDDLKPSLGELKVAHIFKRFSNPDSVTVDDNKKGKAFMDSVYTLIQNGADFGKLASDLSDDNGTAKNGGVMKFIGFDFVISDFAIAAFTLKNNGDYSQPVRTKYGWHIIKRLETRPEPTFAEMEIELTKKVKSDPLRSKYSKMKFIDNMKKEYGFISYDNNIKKFKEIIQAYNSDTIFSLPDNCKKLVLFTFAGKDNTPENYSNSIRSQFKINYVLKSKFAEGLNEYIDQVITDYENSKLEEKYPEFKYLINEYHDGILLFAVMESEVWNKAIADTVGLENYYEQNKGKYLLGEHYDGLYIKCIDLDSRKLIEQSIEKGITDADSLMAIANKGKENEKKKNIVTRGRFEKGSNRHVDFIVWGGEKPRTFNNDLEFVNGGIKPNGVKTLEEARGLYISDYQAVIEKEWLKQLRQKYVVKINEKLLSSIKSVEKKK